MVGYDCAFLVSELAGTISYSFCHLFMYKPSSIPWNLYVPYLNMADLGLILLRVLFVIKDGSVRSLVSM